MTKRKISILLIALIGFITTIKLAVIYYNANFNAYALSSFCSVNDFIDCDGIAQSSDSQFLGVPLAYWGMFFYLIVIFLTLVNYLKNIKFLNFLSVFKNPLSYISVLGLFSFLVSMGLATLSLVQIKKLCVLCLFTYFLNLIIFFLAFHEEKISILAQIKNFFIDIFDGIKKYPITFTVLLLTSISFLTYTATTYVFAPHVKKMNSIYQFVNMKTNPYRVSGNLLGDKDAKITVKLYSDYVCPICYAYNLMIHKAMKELNNIKIEHHNFPLDKECNKHIRIQIHNNACMMARYAIAAENQNKYWDMTSELFEQQPKNDDEAIKIAKKLGINVDKFKQDINSEVTKQKLLRDIDEARAKGLKGTPAIIIEDELFVGIKPYYELKELLINAGANGK